MRHANDEHEYAEWDCPGCGQSLCWGCATRCTNDGTGDGEIRCPECGRSGSFGSGSPHYE